jgi:hypothetical protein
LWVQFWGWMQWCKIYSNFQHLHSSVHHASRIQWRKAKLEHLWILPTKYDG